MRISRLVLLATALFALCAVTGRAGVAGTQVAGKKAGGKGSRSAVVAEWQGGTVTTSQLEEFSISKAGMAMRHGNVLTAEGIRRLLDEMIGQKILVREAMTLENLSDPRFTGACDIAFAQEIANRYTREILKARFAVSDNELSAALPKDRSIVRIKVLVVPTAVEAEEVLKGVKAGMTFDEGVEKYSLVKSPPGSFIDLRDTDDYLDDEGRRRVRSLAKGDISPVLPMKIGYGIVLVFEKRDMDEKEWSALAQERRIRIFQKKVGAHYDGLRKNAAIEVNGTELMMAAGEDFEFLPSRRVVLAVSGRNVYFDDYVRTRDIHLRDAMKVTNARDLYNAYKVEFENLGITLALAKEVASEQGWTEPPLEKKTQIRETVAVRVLGENLFEGLAVTDAEARKEYDGNRKFFTVKKRYKVRRITFSSAEEAKRFRNSVKSPEMFYKELRARETRDDRFQNTYFEWKDAENLDEISRKEFEKTRKGKLTPVISPGVGVHYVYLVDDIEKNHLIPFEEVRMGIKRGILRQKQEKKLGEFVGKRVQKYKVKIHEEPLGKLLAEIIRKRKKLDPGHGKDAEGIR